MSQIAPALLPQMARIISMPEATYGVTPTTGTAFWRAILPPLSFSPIDGMTDVPEVGDASVNSRDQRLIGQTLLAPTGNMKTTMDLENTGWLLRMALGNPTATVGSGPTVGLTQDAYLSGGTVGSDTVQYSLGDEVRRASGVAVDSFSLPLGKVDGVREMEFSMIAREVLRNPSAWAPAATPTARKAPYYIPGFISSVLVNGSAVPIESGNLNFANNFVRRQETNGSRFTSDAAGGTTACSGQFSIALRNAAGLNAYAGTTASVALGFVFQIPGNERKLTITLPRAFVMVPDLTIDSGPATAELTFEAKSPLTGTVGTLSAEVWRTT